jgi:hypothetical protein
MRHVEVLINDLKAHGLKYVESRTVAGQPFTFAVFRNVPGRSRVLPDGKVPLLAVPIPDDPQLPPPGFHMHPPLGKGVSSNVQDSPLSTSSEQWAYWSRPLQGWDPARGAARIVSHLHSTLRDA